MGNQKLQHGFNGTKILDAPFMYQIEHQAGVEFAHQDAGNACVQQRCKGVPSSDMEERERDQHLPVEPDDAGSQDVE